MKRSSASRILFGEWHTAEQQNLSSKTSACAQLSSSQGWKEERVREESAICLPARTDQPSVETRGDRCHRAGPPREPPSLTAPGRMSWTGPARGTSPDRINLLSAELMTLCSGDEEATMLRVRPFLIPSTDGEDQEAMTVNIPEVVNKLGCSKQTEELQEK